MSNLLKRAVSVVMGEGDYEIPTKKPNLTEIGSGDGNGTGDEGVMSKESRKVQNDDDDDDDLFEELNEPASRVIHKASEMVVGAIYQLVDIYSLNVEDRVAIVGGFKLDGESEIMYVWMPASLVKNYDSKKVAELKCKLDKGKKGYAVYRGMKGSKYGNSVYDMSWVQKSK